jgi:hypothetical protein
LVLDKFTDGLPREMYEHIYNLENSPVTNEEWRTKAIERQKRWFHMKGQLDQFKTPTPKPTFGNRWGGFGAPKDPNAMDTTPGRVRGRVMEVGDINRPSTNPFRGSNNPFRGRGGGNTNNRGVVCYNCNKPGHFACDCRSPRVRHPGFITQGPSNARQIEAQQEDDNLQIARGIAEESRTPQQKATDWLSGVANEDDDVKDIVMQALWKREDF